MPDNENRTLNNKSEELLVPNNIVYAKTNPNIADGAITP